MFTDSSGTGEDILRHSVTGKVAALSGIGSLNDNLAEVITTKVQTAPSACAIAAIDASGRIAIESSGRVFPVASCTPDGPVASVLSTTIHVLPQHIIYHDRLVTAGLTRYPITPGHAVVVCHGVEELFSLPLLKFLDFMYTARLLSETLISGSNAQRCGLTCNGSGILSLLPLYGLTKDWKPVICSEEEFNASYPGYLTSKNGPRMADSSLNETRSRIAEITGIFGSFDKQFEGDTSDQNLFARIIRGEVPQWRIWEDTSHVAFLTPFGNTPGCTVLVPRRHLSSDIFQLDDDDFTAILKAAYKVAQYLKNALGVKRCGIFFEGYEINYAHVKLIPVHMKLTAQGRNFNPIAATASFSKTYEGFLTTQSGPLASDLDSMTSSAKHFRNLHTQKNLIAAPKTWHQPSSHSLQALQSPWYAAVFSLQNSLFHASISFFQRQLQFKYALVPVTTDSVSSPMGLGSDSQPVRVALFDQNTYLADSMQFTLEYVLRMEKALSGAYYIGCSFRGEDTDPMHLNQFYHIECELPGLLDDGIDVAERYIVAVTHAIMDKHAETVYAIAGSTSHCENLLSLAKVVGGHFPRVTLSNALSLEEIDGTPNAWQYAVANDHKKGRMLTRLGERILIKKFGGVVWLTEMDHLSVPFYQAFVPHTGNGKALCADLLLGPGEVLGLGQRHENPTEVSEALKMHEVPMQKYEWYSDIRDEAKGGKCLQTTGWGMGMERYLAWLFKHDDIRDMAIFPRMKGMRFCP